MKKANLIEVAKILKHIIKEEIELQEPGLLKESETIDDFFNFLEIDPQKASFSYAYYTYPMRTNKTVMGGDGIKVPNPYDGKIFKSQQFQFRYAQVYGDVMRQINPDYVPGKTSGTYEKVQGFSVLKMGKSGLYFPIMPTSAKSAYFVEEDGQNRIVDYEEIKAYLPPSNGYVNEVDYKNLIVDRIARISAGGKVWNNPHFKYTYLGPKSETF